MTPAPAASRLRAATLLAALAAPSALAATSAGAQSAGAQSAGETPDAPRPARAFSPQAITDLLRQGARAGDAGRSGGARAPDPLPGARPDPAVARLVPETVNATRFSRPNEMSRGVDPVVLKAEILLDRAHAPPGVIDGRFGANFTKAVAAFETLRGLPADGRLTRRVWDELGADAAAPVLGTYEIRAADVVGPFYPDLSPDYAEQARMPDLGYRSAEDMFAERFHMDRKFLRALNPGVDMAVPGATIVVAEVATLPIAAAIARIDVDKGRGQVQAYDAAGSLVVAYPATIGSDELPSPSGSWLVRGIAPHPTYTYDPKKNFQQGSNTQKLILPPGPNNPVGAAFIALTKPTYGIHGTPDPSKIDKTRSHGCVRLTNWNAVELASLVKVGVPVNFIDKPGAEPPAEPDIAAILAADPKAR